VIGVPTTLAPTAQRILDAAAAEFAERGLAGARVDRIADRASANKQRLYAYFGSKEELFDRVVEAHLSALLDAVPFDADDVPGYAARLFTFNRAHPEMVRLIEWHHLERPGRLSTLPDSSGATGAKVERLRAAQRLHPDRVDPTVTAERLLGQILALVHGATLAAELAETDDDEARDDIARSVTRIIVP
jgi:AcrR family transcriptional regulator